jgi:tRNA-splicing ligase RtcB (3'-phosphate/5'-hydroxy nucleic acid ligase)
MNKNSNDEHYLVIHSGSRNLGVKVAKFHQDIAIKSFKEIDKKSIIDEYISLGKQKELEKKLKEIDGMVPKIPKELSYLEGEKRDDYLHDMKLCQVYADRNREEIAARIVSEMGWSVDEKFTTVHNYYNFEDNIIRKGAVSAKEDEMLLIPMNMRDGSLLCKGKGNVDWNCSAPHGAGRLMSRKKAKEVISIDEFKKSMIGVNTFSVCDETIDEAPMAYKPMEEIKELIGDTVEILDVLKPVYNFKAKK